MIKSFAGKHAAAVFAGHAVRGLPMQIQRRARTMLLMIEAAGRLDDPGAPPGNRLEALRSDRRGQHGIRINEQWRICFVWRDGDGWEVELVDYHRGDELIMVIKREDVDRRKVGFSDVASGRRLPPVHPGEVLREEFLTPMELSVSRLAREIKVSRPRLNELVLGRRAVTTDTALRLGRYFGTTPEFWINLQTRHDPDVAERTMRRRIEREVAPRAA